MEFLLRSRRVLFDEPVPFTIEAVAAGTPVEVAVECTVAGAVLRSSAIFVSDERGAIDPALVAPVAGAYSGIDGRGLYWSADPTEDWPGRASIDDVPVRAVARIDDRIVGSVEYVRAFIGAGVEAALVNVGQTERLFTPNGTGPFPGVVVLGGSDAGRAGADVFAAAFASRGVAALAVGYFGMKGLPAFHQAVPLENLHRAINWLQGHPVVRPGGVGVFGTSRGGEFALLLGATSSQVNRVVANVGSGIVWSGMDSTGPTWGSAWSLDGHPVPCVQRRPDSELNRAAYAAAEVELRLLFEHDLAHADPRDVDQATIAVERTKGPILMFSGEADALWPSTPLAEVAVARARAARLRWPVEHISYGQAGHGCVRVPGHAQPTSIMHPVIGKPVKLGGTRPANAAATADAWARVIPFLHQPAD